MSDINDEVRAAVAELKTSILKLSTETAGEAREKLVEFANLAESCAVDLVTGKLTFAQATEAKDNLMIAARSALIHAGYESQARALDIAGSAVGTALKLLLALA